MARIFALLDRDHPHCAHHVDVDDIEDAGRRGDGINLQVRAELTLERRPRLVRIERHAPTEQPLWIESPEHEVRISHRRARAATAICSGARLRASTHGTDL